MPRVIEKFRNMDDRSGTADPPSGAAHEVLDRIDAASALAARFGRRILGNSLLRDRLNRYRGAVGGSWETMENLNVVACCARCAGEGSGSCCFEGVEGWYDEVLLLINLLMGVDMPRRRELPGHCLFVGNGGCRLKARESFCVNYLCARLKNTLAPGDRRRLQQVVNTELREGWELERSLRGWLRGWGRGGKIR